MAKDPVPELLARATEALEAEFGTLPGFESETGLDAEALAANESMRSAIASFGGPVYAECGGFMYLMREIVDAAGGVWPMAGIFPTTARMQKRLAKLGYVEVQSAATEGWGLARGHEFRYSMMDPMPQSVTRLYREPAEGYRVGSVVGSYIHLHFLSCPRFAEQFVENCAGWRTQDSK